jgi:hypothetical protein
VCPFPLPLLPQHTRYTCPKHSLQGAAVVQHSSFSRFPPLCRRLHSLPTPTGVLLRPSYISYHCMHTTQLALYTGKMVGFRKPAATFLATLFALVAVCVADPASFRPVSLSHRVYAQKPKLNLFGSGFEQYKVSGVLKLVAQARLPPDQQQRNHFVLLCSKDPPPSFSLLSLSLPPHRSPEDSNSLDSRNQRCEAGAV